MTLDSKKFTAALDDKLQQVSDLFTVSDGMALSLIPIIKNYALSDGLLADRITGINTSIKNIDKRIIQLESRITKYGAQLLKQFTALESTVAKLQSQGNYLAQTFKY
jgi:flagellar hook-associated protein 2